MFLLSCPLWAFEPNLDQIKTIANDVRTHLQMPQEIQVAIVPANALMVSVERTNDAFIICFDEHFLTTLDQEELTAAVAHELGHVWIYSHHPYLQTEALANEIAMKAVTRESLKKVYTKLWAQMHTGESLEEFLGARM